MPRPPFNRQTPIGRAGTAPVSISAEFSRYLSELVRLADGDAVDISGLEARMAVAEAKNTAQDGEILANAGDISANAAAILTNTNNIASLVVNVTQLQTDMTTAQGDILANAGAIAALRDAPVRVITGEF